MQWLALPDQGLSMTIYNAYPPAFAPSNFQSEFRVAILWLFNKYVFGKNKFLGSIFTPRPYISYIERNDRHPNSHLPVPSTATFIEQSTCYNIQNDI